MERNESMKDYTAIYFYCDFKGNKIPVGVTDYGALSDLLIPAYDTYEMLEAAAGYGCDIFAEIVGVGCFLLKKPEVAVELPDGDNHGA